MGKKSGKKDANNKRESRGVDSFPDDDVEEFMSVAYGDDNNLNSKTPSVIDDDLQSRLDEMNTTVIKSSSFDISEAVDMLIEKKVNLREPGLTSIINHLRSSGTSAAEFEHLADYIEVLITRVVRMLRRPASAKEGNLCCSVLALLALYLGPLDDTLLKTSEKVLTQIVDRNDEDFSGLNELRCNALFTYCFLVYIYQNEEQVVATLDYLQLLMIGESSGGNDTEHGGVVTYSDEVKAKAIDCWVFLASHLDESEVLERAREGEVFETIATLMDGAFNDLNMKISAGRAVAFLWETAHNAQTELSFDQLGHLLCYNPRIVHEVQEAIQKVVVDSSKKVSKKNKKEQRAEFRDIESWVLHQDFPVEKIRMQGAEVEISSFAQQRVVESLRQVLESGFHSSLRMYPVVKNILEVEFLTDDMDGAGMTYKVQKGSVVDKERTRNMKQDRRHRDVSLYAGGYESD